MASMWTDPCSYWHTKYLKIGFSFCNKNLAWTFVWLFGSGTGERGGEGGSGSDHHGVSGCKNAKIIIKRSSCSL